MHLYSRACRKYRQNKFIKLEYLQYLLSTDSMQMLNKVLAECLQVMPQEVEFWQIGAYAELDVKGNMFSGRQLMLQGLRQNEDSSKFHLEYLRFEIKTFDKVMKRREVLLGDKLNFVEDSDIEGETKRGDEANLVKIVFKQLAAKY